jgi:8-oxo-dGTP pyrophosphatase MutT (NUDIX family)
VHTAVADLLSRYLPQNPAEAADLSRVDELVRAGGDAWARTRPLHLTASAVVVHPATGRVLMRWHERQQAWLPPGGHADPGESDPLGVAVREAREETGLTDLAPWPAASLLHVVVVPVPANATEPAHEHADLRFVLATTEPDDATPERPGAPLRWFTLPQAREATAEPNVRDTLDRVARLLPG